MPDPATLLVFGMAALALIVVPGPAVLYIVSQSIDRGRLAGFVSALGIAVGGLVHVLAAAIGLSSILVSSATAFNVVKYAGAAYLIYLGLKALRRPAAIRAPGEFAPPQKCWIARDGFLVALLNPKTALFFSAFLPQFIDRAAGSTALQGALFGVVFVAVAACTDSAYVLAANVAGARLGRSPRFETIGRYAAAATYFGLGLFTAATGSRNGR